MNYILIEFNRIFITECGSNFRIPYIKRLTQNKSNQIWVGLIHI